jgi:hypothetical protein
MAARRKLDIAGTSYNSRRIYLPIDSKFEKSYRLEKAY